MSHHENCKKADDALNIKLVKILEDYSLQDSNEDVLSNFANIHQNKHQMTEMLTVFQILKESEGILSVIHKQDEHENCNETRFLVQCPEKWNYFNSVLFSLVTITTIGYGHQVPNTNCGRIFCVIYASVGIPLVGFFVYYWTKGINHLDKQHISPCLHGFCKKFQKSKKTRHVSGSDGVSTLELQPHRVVAFVIIWYLLPTIIFWWKESDNGWSLFTAFYFCFITLSSIGFGDYTPSHMDNSSFLCNFFYYGYIFLWILSGFVCTNVFLNRLGFSIKRSLLKKGDQIVQKCGSLESPRRSKKGDDRDEDWRLKVIPGFLERELFPEAFSSDCMKKMYQ